MTNALSLSSRIYCRLLVFYPEDLRRSFGADMALLFAEDLDAAWREAGMCGVMRVWWCALGEFLRLALPGHWSSPAVRVPAIWFALATAIMSVEMGMALRDPRNAMTPFHAVCGALMLPSLTTPLMALAASWACRGRTLISLGLSNAMGEER